MKLCVKMSYKSEFTTENVIKFGFMIKFSINS